MEAFSLLCRGRRTGDNHSACLSALVLEIDSREVLVFSVFGSPYSGGGSEFDNNGE